MMYGYEGSGFGGVMMIGMVFFWVLILVLAVVFIRRFVGHGHFHHGHNSYHGHQGHFGPQGVQGDQAMDIARRRLASGEISPEEFEKIKEVLNK